MKVKKKKGKISGKTILRDWIFWVGVVMVIISFVVSLMTFYNWSLVLLWLGVVVILAGLFHALSTKKGK